MADDVDIPQVGPVDKKIVAAIAVSVGGFIAYRYWRVGRASTADTATATDTGLNPEFDSTGDPGTVLGAVSPTNSYGSADTTPSGDAPSVDDFGFHGTTNDAWTQYAATQLAQSDRWSYTDIVQSLGKYLAEKPTTTAEQNIINAAIAVAGRPPVGTHVLIFSPDPIAPVTPATPASAPSPLPVPTGFGKRTVTRNSIQMQWQAVKGAAHYDLDITPGPVYTTNNLHKTIDGLKPNTTYQLRIRAVRAGGSSGAWSPYLSVKTSR